MEKYCLWVSASITLSSRSALVGCMLLWSICRSYQWNFWSEPKKNQNIKKTERFICVTFRKYQAKQLEDIVVMKAKTDATQTHLSLPLPLSSHSSHHRTLLQMTRNNLKKEKDFSTSKNRTLIVVKRRNSRKWNNLNLLPSISVAVYPRSFWSLLPLKQWRLHYLDHDQ